MKAAGYAIELAKTTGGKVVALHVIQLPQYLSESVLSRLKEELTQRGQSALAGVQSSAQKSGVEVDCRVIEKTTSVVSALCDFASKDGAEMIVIGTRGTGGVAKLMLGSVAAGVTRSSTCPVLVVK